MPSRDKFRDSTDDKQNIESYKVINPLTGEQEIYEKYNENNKSLIPFNGKRVRLFTSVDGNEMYAIVEKGTPDDLELLIKTKRKHIQDEFKLANTSFKPIIEAKYKFPLAEAFLEERLLTGDEIYKCFLKNSYVSTKRKISNNRQSPVGKLVNSRESFKEYLHDLEDMTILNKLSLQDFCIKWYGDYSLRGYKDEDVNYLAAISGNRLKYYGEKQKDNRGNFKGFIVLKEKHGTKHAYNVKDLEFELYQWWLTSKIPSNSKQRKFDADTLKFGNEE